MKKLTNQNYNLINMQIRFMSLISFFMKNNV